MKKKEFVQAVKGNTEKFKRDLFNRLDGEFFTDSHQIQERLEELAKEMITDYIYFESDEFDKTQDKAEEIVNRHIEAFYTLAE